MESTKEVTRLRDLKLSARDQLMLDPRTIQIEDGMNPRDYALPENRAHLDWLKANIKENGTLNPLLVRYDPALKAAVLVDGECRLRANLELIAEGIEIMSVPTIQVPGNNQAERLLTAVTANTGKPLSKWELGAAFLRFRKFGWDDESISKRSGYSQRFITEAIELSDAPQEVKELLSDHAVTPALALSELRTNGAGAVDKLRERANAAKEKGDKTAKRGQPNRIANPKQLFKLVAKLIEGVEGDIFDAEYKFVEVERATMVQLAKLVGISADGREKK
jgi:ParB-like chromosome segregation protein Spo0J